jgi:hypothetical protein
MNQLQAMVTAPDSVLSEPVLGRWDLRRYRSLFIPPIVVPALTLVIVLCLAAARHWPL